MPFIKMNSILFVHKKKCHIELVLTWFKYDTWSSIYGTSKNPCLLVFENTLFFHPTVVARAAYVCVDGTKTHAAIRTA